MSSNSDTTSNPSTSGEDSNHGRRGRRRARGGIGFGDDQGRAGTVGRGRGRSRSRRSVGGRGPRRRGTSRAMAVDVEQATESVPDIDQDIEDELDAMSQEELRNLCKEMKKQHPGILFDILRPATRQPGGYHPPPGTTPPNWCVCTKCWEMPKESERVCCGKQRCVSLLRDFHVLVMDESVLKLARMFRRDILVYDDEADAMAANRHQAYRQFTLLKHGMLGAGDRRVVPSCCTWAIRDKYPDPFNTYTGFIPSRFG